MPITETIKKGQIKRKVDSSNVEILRPETEAELVIYNNTTSGLTATDAQAAIDEVAAAIAGAGKVDDVKIQVDSGTATSIVTNKIATIPVTSSYSGTSNTIVNGKAIKAAIDGLDVSEFKLTETNTTTNVVTLHGIKEADGKIAVGTTSSNDVTFYNKTGADNAISTAINALDTSSDVRIAPVDSGIISFKDIKEVNGIVSASSTDTGIQTYTKGTLDTKFGNKVDKYTSSSDAGVVYGVNAGGTQTTFSLSRADGTTLAANQIPVRTTDGQIIVPATPTADGHAASKKYVDDKITSGVEYLGIVDDTTELYALDSSAGEGDWVRVGTQFTYSSETCHVGDILICSAAKGSSTHATWDVLHTEVDTDTNTKYQALVAASGTGYAGAIKLQAKELGGSWADQDTIKFIQGTNVTITPDATNKTLTIAHSTPSGATTKSSGFYKFSTDSQGHVNGTTAVAKADLTGLGVADDDLVVHLAGAETITGAKTFASDILLNNGSSSPTLSFRNGGGQFTLSANGTGNTLKYSASGRSQGSLDINFPAASGTLALQEAIAPAYDETATYAVGNKVTHFGKFYKCSTAIETAESWTAAHWTEITVAGNYVEGPASATDNHIAIFDGTTGKIIKDSYLNIIRTTGNAPEIIIDGHSAAYYTDLFGMYGARILVDAGAQGRLGVELARNYDNATSKFYTDLLPYGTDNVANLGSSSKKWQNLYLAGNLSDGTKSTTIANIVDSLATITTNVKSGKKSDGTTDISGSKSGTIITLGDSGITAGTYSAIQVNAKGIAVAGGQILDVIANGGTPNIVNGGWYFEEFAAA